MHRSGIASLLLVTSLAAAPILVGCDKDAARPGDKVVNQQEKTTSDPNGNQSTTEQKTVQHSDGSTTTEKHTDAQHTNP
jgi:hypothetical protein